MKIKPIVMQEINTTHTSFIVDLHLDYNVTFITGDSGVGKSALYSFIEELSANDKRIRCFNYLDQKELQSFDKNSKDKLFVIDNADILLDDKMRQYIAFDAQNQYIIIGRNPTGLMLELDEIYELSSENINGRTLLSLKKSF